MITQGKSGTSMVSLNPDTNKIPPHHVAVMLGVQGHGGAFGLLWSADLTKTLQNFDDEAASHPSDLTAVDLVDAIMQIASAELAAGNATSLPVEALLWALCRLRSDPDRDTEAALRDVVRRDGTANLCGIVTDRHEGMIAVWVTPVAPEDVERFH